MELGDLLVCWPRLLEGEYGGALLPPRMATSYGRILSNRFAFFRSPWSDSASYITHHFIDTQFQL